MTQNNIVIQEKPDWVSWEDIKQCLYEAHAPNREHGIRMSHYLWPAEKIKESIGDNGLIFVALDGKKVIGTAAYAERKSASWYSDGKCAFLCYGCLIPEYTGRGIFAKMAKIREEKIKVKGYSTIIFDTHSKNIRRQKIALKQGFHYIRYFKTSNGDHYNVVMAKWLDGFPYSPLYCKFHFYMSVLKVRAYSILSKLKSKVLGR